MWDKLQKIAQHPAVQMLKKICGDPVQLYIILIMTSIMEYYQSDMNWLYTLLAVFLSFVLMKFYDFVAKHKFLGPLCYLVFLFLGLYGVSVLTEIGRLKYPIGFLVWFLTPQSVVEFSIWYTIAIYLLMMGFLSSAVYYFSKVRYRMVMQFLIMLIPLSLYAKEGIQMSAFLVILLLSSYFLLMIYCRQLRETPEIRRLHGFHGSMSVTAYVLAFSILAAVVPKPNVKADREYIENAMSYSSLSDVLMDMISMFTDTTDNSAMMSANARTLYYAQASEPLRLRTQTYTFYGEDDSWNKNNYCDYPSREYAEVTFYKPQDLLQAILDAAAADETFAQTYGLTEFAESELPLQQTQQFAIFTNLPGTNMIPSPTRVSVLEEWRQPVTMVSRQNALTPKLRTYDFREKMSMTYYSDTYALHPIVSQVLGSMKQESYQTLLHDAAEVLLETDAEAAALLDFCSQEQQDAMEYLEYCETKDYQSEAVDALALEITAGLESDIEKARAIEQYFTDMGFVYDLSYIKEDGDNVDEFLTESKRGVCYEYATAMVLLCRSAGLPARYVQGYSMNERYQFEVNEVETNYAIKVRDAHGFPEVYISGYGWLSFEPTVAADVLEEDKTAENFYVMIWGFVLLGLVFIAAVLYFMMPILREKYFLHKTGRKTPQQASSEIFCHMRRIMQLSDSATMMELADASAKFTGNADDMQQFYANMDAFLYDPDLHPERTKRKTDVTTSQLIRAYVQWQEKRSAYVKEEKKNRKKVRKKM